MEDDDTIYGNGVELLMETYCHNCLRVFLM